MRQTSVEAAAMMREPGPPVVADATFGRIELNFGGNEHERCKHVTPNVAVRKQRP